MTTPPVRSFPALVVEWVSPPDPDRTDRLLAVLDDEGPTAVEERASGLAVFFSSDAQRDRAADLVKAFAPDARVDVVAVSDESWAERSQAALGAIRVGRVVVTPPWAHATFDSSPDDIVITIVPSMGFGTGHHASTRQCLALLQRLDVAGRSVLDVGTGSGLLAIAALRLGAARVLGVDVDTDALVSATENVERNGAADAIVLRPIDLAHAHESSVGLFDLVLANLTGGMLERYAAELQRLLAPGSSLVVSGFQVDEERAVAAAFEAGGLAAADRAEEDRWVARRFTH